MSTSALSCPTVPRPVVVVIDHLGRSVPNATRTAEGRFVHCGVELDLGCRPDWIGGGLAGDEEWRIEWVKFYEGLDLAHAFGTTGTAVYLTAWKHLVGSFCEQVPVGFDTSDVSARRVQNWLYSWLRFHDAPHFTGLPAEFTTRLVDRIAQDVTHIREHLTAERNHRTLELYAVLLASLALPEIDPDGEVARWSIDRMSENAQADILDDGVQRELSTDYHMIVLRSLLGTIANARRFGLALPSGFLARVDAACDFALHIQRPDGTTPSLSDGDVGDFRDVLGMAASLLHREDLRWVASGGSNGTVPVERDRYFPHGGYVTQRSGWGTGPADYTDQRFLIMDCGPLGDGGHGHYDQLSVEICAGGRPLIVDPGRYTYAEDAAGWRRWFKGTAAHNTVTVDNRDQTPYRRGKPKGAQSSAKLIDRYSEDGAEFLIGEVRSPHYGAIHTRTVAFVRRQYWVISDRMEDSESHEYCARWHLPPDLWDSLEVSSNLTAQTVRTDAVTIAVPHTGGTLTIEEGWVSPSYGIKQSAPVVAVRAFGTTADLVAVITPGRRWVEARLRRDVGGCRVTGVRGASNVANAIDNLRFSVREGVTR